MFFKRKRIVSQKSSVYNEFTQAQSVLENKKTEENDMKRVVALLLALVMTLSLFTACGSKESTTEPETKQTDSSTAAPEASGKSYPSEPAKEDNQAYSTDTEAKDYSGRTLRLLLSIGGGGNYYEPIAQRMMELYPGLTVELEYSNNAADVLRTQVLSGNAPDIYNVNSGTLPWYDAIEQGIATPIDEIFELPTMDGSQTLGDVMTDMGMFSLGQYEGHYYVMHEFQYLDGFWYDAAYFRENNLTVPTDWDSLCELAEQADALGTKLLGYMGIAATEYGVGYWLWPMIAATDYELYKSLINLDYEAAYSDSMKRVVEKMEFVRDGNYDINTMGCSATEAQLAFIDHDHLIYPCGSWLEAEMDGAWTEGWELTYLPYSFGDEAGNGYIRTGGLASMVSPTTQNWDLVCEFYRLMFSDDQAIRDSVSVHRNVMMINGFSENYGDLVDASVNTAAAVFDEVTPIMALMGQWYPEVDVALGDALNAFMGGDIDGEGFMDRVYSAIKTVAEDDSVTKYTLE